MTIEKLPPETVLTVRLFGADAERIVALLMALLDLPNTLTRPGELRIQRTLEAFRAAVLEAKRERERERDDA
jgi:hypothetical protein